MMTPELISYSRLMNQKIKESAIHDPAELVGAMGAMQAQDFAMSLWAVALRLRSCPGGGVKESFNSGAILRTHVLRPTWHLVAAKDIRWMLSLTAPRIKAGLKSRWKALELDELTFMRSREELERTLEGGKHLTREEILAGLANIMPVFDQRGAHLILRAELDGLICSGAMRHKRQTYALLDQRVPPQGRLSEEEALGKLTQIYFSSHGPATVQDFVWWSGLSVSLAKKGLDIVGTSLSCKVVGGKLYWFSTSSLRFAPPAIPEVFLLPAYDEFLIAYNDRSPSLDPAAYKHAFSNNGIFRPVIVVNGIVSGIWKRTIKRGTVIVEPAFFSKPTAATQDRLEEEADRYGAFLNLKAEVHW